MARSRDTVQRGVNMFKIAQSQDQCQITFKKGTKPRSIKEAQRETCTIYKDLCAMRAPRGLERARATYFDSLGQTAATLLRVSPYYTSYVTSASRAYSALETGLAAREFYHMNVTLSLDDLVHFKDLSQDLLAALRATGLQEFMFMAREA